MNTAAFIFAVIDVVLIILIISIVIISFVHNGKRIRTNKNMQNKMQEVQKNLCIKNSYLMSMSRDLRIPMNTLMGYTELLKKNADKPELVEEYIAKLEMAEGHMLQLMNNVLQLSDFEKNQVHFEYTASDISDAIELIKKYMEDRTKEKFITFNAYEEVTYPYIFEDKGRITEIIIRLLENSLQFTPDGGNIEAYLIQHPGRNSEECLMEFGLTNEGMGIPQSFLDKLFGPNSDELFMDYSSMGEISMGLLLIKKTVDLMGGALQIENGEQNQCRITVKTYHKYATREDLPASYYEEAQEKEGGYLKGTRVLIVEDNELNQEIAYDLLTEAGFVAEVVENGKKACDLLQERGVGAFDVVLMDIQMPIMDGYEATHTIRGFSDKALAQIPIIAMTANAFEADREKSLSLGMDEHITKPINLQQVMNVISRVIGHSERGNRVINLS